MTVSHDDAPLILTLRFDEESAAFFERKRQQHFPAERNHIPAHCTLFHHLPSQEEPEICRTLAELGRRTAPFPVEVAEVMFMGFGSAFRLRSETLQSVHETLSGRFHPWLTKQDRQGFKPHVTFQNKVKADHAKTVHASEAEAFQPFTAAATGLLLWRYRGGPWEAAGAYAFEKDRSEG